MKRCILPLLSLFLFFSCKNNPISNILDKEKSTFIIYTYDEFGAPSGSGSGFFIDESGVGLTNFHVLDGASKAVIVTTDSLVYNIEKVITGDRDKDIVKFMISNKQKKQFPILSFADNEPKTGDKVYCISSPQGLENSLSEGIISALRSDKKHGKTIQFTAPISPGSSGSPVLNEDGEVIAISAFNRTNGQNLNFGIRSNKGIIDSLNKDNFSKYNSKFSIGDRFVVLNSRANNDPFTTLNAIEFGDDITTCYFTYTRLNITPTESKWGFWLDLNKGDTGFYLRDRVTNTKYYIKASTVGDDRDHMTDVPLASSFRYKVFLPRIEPSISSIEVLEGPDSRASHWENINLKEHRDLDKIDDVNYQLGYAFAALDEKNLKIAEGVFQEVLEKDPENMTALNSLGVISYVTSNFRDALMYFTRAIEVNPTVEESYINRHFMYLVQDDIPAALEDISKAISMSPSYPEYYLYRERLYLMSGDKEKAMKDYFKADEIFSKDYHSQKIDLKGWSQQSVYDYILSLRNK